MFNLNESNRYVLYSRGVNMRCGVDGLCYYINTLRLDPTNGDVYVFANRTRTLLKLLHWERGGYTIYYKRLEAGRISATIFSRHDAVGFFSCRWDEIVLLMEGISVGAVRRRRFNLKASGEENRGQSEGQK